MKYGSGVYNGERMRDFLEEPLVADTEEQAERLRKATGREAVVRQPIPPETIILYDNTPTPAIEAWLVAMERWRLW